MILTRLERETLLAIYKFVKEQNSRGIATPDPPSVRELMPMVKVLSTSSINYRIDKPVSYTHLTLPTTPYV